MSYIDKILEMMRKNPAARILFVTHSFAPGLEPFEFEAGEVWVTGDGYDPLRAFELDLLLKAGLVEKERESRETIYYRLSESAK